jgi:hypothetical protein
MFFRVHCESNRLASTSTRQDFTPSTHNAKEPHLTMTPNSRDSTEVVSQKDYAQRQTRSYSGPL